MKKILFRGKRVDNGEWVEGFYLILGNQYHYILSGKIDITKGYPNCIKYEVIPETVGQYTGMSALWTAFENEPQEADVYEHDILQVFYENKNILAKVEFEQGMFILISNQFADGYIPLSDFAEYDGDDFYIDAVYFGNIHDNPELLNVEKEVEGANENKTTSFLVNRFLKVN